MEQIERFVEGEPLIISNIDSSMKNSVAKLIDTWINRGTSRKKIIDEMIKLDFSVNGSQIVKPAPTVSKKEKSVVAKKEEGKSTRGRKPNPEREAYLAFIKEMKDDGKDDDMIMDGIQNKFKMTYSNAHYYVKKVWPKVCG